MTRSPVSLHISLSPGDLPHARLLLPHQLRTFARHVSEIVLTVDGGEHTAPDLTPFSDLISPFRDTCPAWNLRTADHSHPRRLALAQAIFRRNQPMPHRTYRRGPCLAYYDGWAATNQPYLFHLDSDMFFGGDLGAWLETSVRLLATDPRVFTCSPLAGPPRPDGTINQPDLGSHPSAPRSHTFASFSSRLFLVRRVDVVTPVPPHPSTPAALRNRLRAWLEGLPRLDLPENLLTRRMQMLDQLRVDHPGPATPAFSLHPPHRSPEFYERLPEFITRAETSDFPEAQLGCYDVNEALIDWSPQITALLKRRWWRVLLARLTS
ncbi:MAG: hypothetical protein ACAH89_04775 [Rariglobus sp.]|nr:hypothetical protein [Rariglobus sp.]